MCAGPTKDKGFHQNECKVIDLRLERKENINLFFQLARVKDCQTTRN